MATDHAILAGTPSRWRVPHSRYNELPDAALVSKDYQILSTSPEAGVDMFLKQRKSLFLFLQGHPEYDPEALLREYRRDVGEFLAGERDNYPELPSGYLDENLAACLAELRREAICRRRVDLLAGFPAPPRNLPQPWRRPAIRLYANWLAHLVKQRSAGRAQTGRAHTGFVRRSHERRNEHLALEDASAVRIRGRY
jgi:homoserine O-succinyltransferase/O-acetyltransferase